MELSYHELEVGKLYLNTLSKDVVRVMYKSKENIILHWVKNNTELVFSMKGRNYPKRFVRYYYPKPEPKDFGYYEQEGFDDLPSGWMLEEGEEVYKKAYEDWLENEEDRVR